MLTDREFDDLCRRLYRSVRDGAVDLEAALDLSAEILAANSNADWPAEVTELATAVAALAMGGEADPALLADSARALLAGCPFEPNFEDEPGWLAAVEKALEIVRADLRTCGLPDSVSLLTWEGSPNVCVDAWAANSTGSGIYPEAGENSLTALVMVADDTQDAVMHSIWGAWPVCREHKRGVHAQEQDGAAVWWCTGSGGHSVAQVGQWPRST